MTDSAGAAAETLDYYPFGGIRIDNKASGSTASLEQRKYIGQEYDADTGLVYLNARYYNAVLAKFISQDTLARDNPEKLLADPQSLNEYSYARNNPIILVDANGQTPQQAGMFLAGVGTSFAIGVGITAAVIAAPVIAPFVLTAGIVGLAYEGGNAIKGGINSYKSGGISGLAKDTKNYIDNNPFAVGSIVGAGACIGVCGTAGEAAADIISEMGLSSRLSNNALVVRGGGLANQTAEIIDKAINKSILEGGQGFSVQCSNKCTNVNQVEQLGQFLKNKDLSVVKVGALRAAGGDAVSSPGIGKHADVININGSKTSQLPWEVVKNPNPR